METKLKILRGEQTEVGVPDERWSISSFLDKTEQWFQDWITTSKYYLVSILDIWQFDCAKYY